MSQVTVDKIHVLLVEDDEDHAHLLMRCMEKCDIKTSINHVTDGEQALNYVYAKKGYEDRKMPDLILLDLNLPRISGHEVLEKLKTDQIMCTIPVVVLTTSNIESDRQKHIKSMLIAMWSSHLIRNNLEM